MFILDWYTRKVIGYYARLQSTSGHWLEAVDMAVNQQFLDDFRDKELLLI